MFCDSILLRFPVPLGEQNYKSVKTCDKLFCESQLQGKKYINNISGPVGFGLSDPNLLVRMQTHPPFHTKGVTSSTILLFLSRHVDKIFEKSTVLCFTLKLIYGHNWIRSGIFLDTTNFKESYHYPEFLDMDSKNLLPFQSYGRFGELSWKKNVPRVKMDSDISLTKQQTEDLHNTKEWQFCSQLPKAESWTWSKPFAKLDLYSDSLGLRLRCYMNKLRWKKHLIGFPPSWEKYSSSKQKFSISFFLGPSRTSCIRMQDNGSKANSFRWSQ